MTSAGVKTSFSYNLLLDTFEDAIINPHSTFVMGCDYRVPLLHGLLDRNYVNKLKMSPSYSEESFAREYMSIWSGSSEESWFNFDKMQKYRKIKRKLSLFFTFFYFLIKQVLHFVFVYSLNRNDKPFLL